MLPDTDSFDTCGSVGPYLTKVPVTVLAATGSYLQVPVAMMTLSHSLWSCDCVGGCIRDQGLCGSQGDHPGPVPNSRFDLCNM